MTPPKKTASSKKKTSAADFIPPRPTLAKMRAAAQGCRGCDLYKYATQAVFGEGPRTARVVIVGEQPGDAEDRAGHPFVGPSGKLLDRVLDAAGIAREDTYVTNAVKHFKWAKDARTTRRLHKTPSAGEVRACRPWLDAELALIKPDVIICLGATAAKSLLGRTFSVTKKRGVPIPSELAGAVFATVHPSSVLRSPGDQRAIAERMFLSDLRKVGRYLDQQTAPAKRTRAKAHKLSGWQTIDDRSATSSPPTRSSRR